MFQTIKLSNNKEENYELMLRATQGFISKQDTFITTLSNLSAILNYFLKDINWVGFYLYDGKQLTLGPFQGLPACTVIKMGNGVCGKAAKNRSTVLVKNINEFSGHIACDSASESEIVIPIIKNNRLIGVLDIDSPVKNRFGQIDQLYLEKLIEKLVDILD